MGECITDLASRDNWAIGYQPLSMVDEGREHYNQFKFIAIDKITPTLENIAAGLYPYWSASYVFWHNTGLSTEQEQLANSFVGGLKSLSLVQAANAALQQDNADDNFDDRPVSGYRTPEILDNGNPANVGTLVFSNSNATPPIQASLPFNPNNPVMNLKKMYLCQMPGTDDITEHDVSR